MARQRDRPLLIMSITALLSVYKAMVFLDHSCPQRMSAMTMGYNSDIAEEGVRDANSGGHSAENHLLPKRPPKKEMLFQEERNWCHNFSSVLHSLSSVTCVWRFLAEVATERRWDKKEQPWGMMRMA